jgi:hypothetical protein
MNAISNVLVHAVPEPVTESNSLKAIALFCGLGLVTSLFMAASGLDLGVGVY